MQWQCEAEALWSSRGDHAAGLGLYLGLGYDSGPGSRGIAEVAPSQGHCSTGTCARPVGGIGVILRADSMVALQGPQGTFTSLAHFLFKILPNPLIS